MGSYDKTMSADGGHLEFPIGTKNITFVEVHPMTIHAMFALNWYTGFREDILKHFPMGSYVKTMSADGGHLGWTSGPTDIILKEDHPKTIPSQFGSNWPSGFRYEDFSLFFP